ncbi:MAG: hypothetical protein ABI890_16820 [Lapillicoccus sp.]
MFWIGVVVVLGVALTAAFAFDRRHLNSRGGGDALAAYGEVEVRRHDGLHGNGGDVPGG